MSKLFFVFLLILIAQAWYTTPVHAATYELYGYAYSSNLGWVSFNCENSFAACGGANDFNVSFSGDTGILTGYAYSSNEGWISFNGTGCPDITVALCTPKVSTTTGKVSGWAKFLHGTGSWINLSGGTFPSPTLDGTKGVTYTVATGKFVGFAWSEEFGWIDFKAHAGISGTGVYTNPFATVTSATSPVCTSFTSNPSSRTDEGLVTLSWNITNVAPANPDVTTTYSFSQIVGSQSPVIIPGVVTASAGSYDANVQETTTYTIAVTNTSKSDATTRRTDCSLVVPVNIVIPPTGPGAKLNLIIGRTAARVDAISNIFTSQNKDLRINKGSTFALRWALDAGTSVTPFICTRSIIGLDVPPINIPIAGWTADWNAVANPNGTLQIRTLQDVTPATYQFKIECVNTDVPATTLTSTSKLTISSSTIEEK